MKRSTLILRFVFLFALFLVGCSQNVPPASDVPDSESNSHQVTVETSQGSFVIRLNPSAAPKTVENFMNNVDAGVYDNTLVHEVLKNCIVLMGAYKSEAETPESKQMPNESSARFPNKKWTVAMLHAPNQTQSDSIQFLINMEDNPELDFCAPGSTPNDCGYCVFGEIISGKDVLEKINQTPVQIQGDFEFAPIPPISVARMTRAK